MDIEHCKDKWFEIAFKYLIYLLGHYEVRPDTPESRFQAEKMAQLIGVNAGEIARFINALLRNNIGKSFKRKRAAQIAIAWCRARKAETINHWYYNNAREDELICNTALKIGVDPAEAFNFNDYLGKTL